MKEQLMPFLIGYGFGMTVVYLLALLPDGKKKAKTEFYVKDTKGDFDEIIKYLEK